MSPRGRVRTRFRAACSSSSATTSSTHPTTSSRVTSRYRLFGRINSAVRSVVSARSMRANINRSAPAPCTTGGQVSANRGVDFAGQVGLQGVTRDPRDVGFPQISTRGLYSTFGDPTSFVYRDNQHFELYHSVMLDRGAHRLKAGAYYFHLQFRPEQPDNARGAFTYTGQFSGNAFADFLLGYPTSAVAGIGRGDQNGRTNWWHFFAQDDWRIRRNLTVNLGLRYEYNQHMRDENNRLSSVDYMTPGGRFVIASDGDGHLNPEAQALLPLIPISYVTSQEAGWERGLLSPSKVRLAPRTGFALSLNDDRAVVRGGYGIFLNQWAYSVQTAFSRNLPFFFARQVDVPSRPPGARVSDAKCPHHRSYGRRRAEHHGPRIRCRVHADVERRSAVAAVAGDHGGSLVHGIVDARRRQRDRTQCPGAGPGIDLGPPPDSATGRDPIDSLRRQVHLSRRNVQDRAAPPQRLFLQRQLRPLHIERRCLESGTD